AAELAAEVADRSRWQSGQLRLLDRLCGAVGRAVDLLLDDGTAVSGTLVATGDGWLGVRDGSGHALVPRHGLARLAFPLAGVEASGRPSMPPAVPQRAGLVQVARRLARDRAYVRLLVRGGRQL